MSNTFPAIRRPKSIALIDVAYLFKKRYHTWDKVEHMGAAKATLRDLDNLRHGVDHLIICRDAAPYFRKEIYPAYKAKRAEPEPEEIANRKFLYTELTRLGFNVAWYQGFEADDVIATLALLYSAWCNDVRIVGTDKDMAQCLTDQVTQYIPPVGSTDWIVRDVAAVKEKWGVAPELMPLYQALAGDDSDNIPGCKGCGPVNAARLVNANKDLAHLAQAWADDCATGKPSALSVKLAAQWDNVVMSFKLATLDTNVPIDAEGLLVPHDPMPAAATPTKNSMDIAIDGFVGNETPAHPAQVAVATESDKLFEHAKQVYEARFVSNDNEKAPEPAKAAKDDAMIEQEYDRERSENGESDTTSNEPGEKATAPVQPRKTEALAKRANASTQQNWGLVNKDLQPLDLTAAYTVSAWLLESNLYKQFKTEAQIFAVIARGKELGLGMTTALAGHHIVEGKPTASADLLRALVERDKSFEYMYPTHMSDTRVVWVGKRKNNPEPTTFEYTIEMAIKAGLAKAGNYGDKGNWAKRPQDMLNKTAGSKLARLLWPAATLGLYCPEEMGTSEEELAERYEDEREAA